MGESANDAGLSSEEKEANQQQIDSILQSIDRIASTTSFQGTKLLNGSFDFTVSGQDAEVADLQINGGKIGEDNVDVDVVVTDSAQHAGLVLSLGGGSWTCPAQIRSPSNSPAPRAHANSPSPRAAPSAISQTK